MFLEIGQNMAKSHLVSDLEQLKVIILFGSQNQRIFPWVYKKMKEYGIVLRTMSKKIRKYPQVSKELPVWSLQKRIDLIQVIIYIGFPNLLIEGRTRGVEELQMNVQKKFHSVNRRLNIAITRIEKPYGQPNILAEYIALQLKNRVSFRKAMKKAIELTEQTDTKGIQVQIAGRIDGKEIARVEWIREGRVPLQTIRAKIDHCSYTIRTIYGVLGIKIWIFVNQE
uniref:Small ribosomal subunit protein uS3c n=1 Tax=Cymbidium ensifolium TaxID=78740 RepID=A0A0S1YCD0_CYMEN|nr:30S ribosomal protein S3 [Cymbidium ensifolium]ALM87901.1 30S ribosomal protein S3 [Cymbidium ensifolium]